MTNPREVVGVVISKFTWDTEAIEQTMIRNKRISNCIQISADRRHIYIKEDEYIFRNFFGHVKFEQGIHYWEVVADSRTDNELKIGVSAINDLSQSPVYQERHQELQEQQIIMSAQPGFREKSLSDLSNDIQLSFSDLETGWAFFGIGQKRHASNMHGGVYGKNFKN